MATRRPKVPRADALGRQPQEKADGGEVIRADFGGARQAPAPKTPATKPSTRKPSAPKASAAKAARTKAPSAAAGTSGVGGSGVGGSAESTQHDPVPAKAFSGRMLALAVVMIAITIMLAPTVKIFLEKRAEISALEAEIESKKSEQAELNKQLSRWQDPSYVKQQARDRINMVMPGETGYWVFGGDVPAGTPGGRTGSGASGSPANLPWVDALWESIRRSATD